MGFWDVALTVAGGIGGTIVGGPVGGVAGATAGHLGGGAVDNAVKGGPDAGAVAPQANPNPNAFNLPQSQLVAASPGQAQQMIGGQTANAATATANVAGMDAQFNAQYEPLKQAWIAKQVAAGMNPTLAQWKADTNRTEDPALLSMRAAHLMTTKPIREAATAANGQAAAMTATQNAENASDPYQFAQQMNGYAAGANQFNAQGDQARGVQNNLAGAQTADINGAVTGAGQQALVDRYNSDLNGGAPSLAQAQLNANTSQNIAQQNAMAANAGPMDYAAARRQAMIGGAGAQQQAGQSAAMLRAQEYANAEAGMGNVLQQQRGQTLQGQQALGQTAMSMRGQDIQGAGQQYGQQNQFLSAYNQSQANQLNANIQQQQIFANNANTAASRAVGSGQYDTTRSDKQTGALIGAAGAAYATYASQPSGSKTIGGNVGNVPAEYRNGNNPSTAPNYQ